MTQQVAALCNKQMLEQTNKHHPGSCHPIVTISHKERESQLKEGILYPLFQNIHNFLSAKHDKKQLMES